MLRVLKPGGLAYFAGVPNYNSLAIRWGLSDFEHNCPPSHVNFFTTDTMGKLLRSSDVQQAIASTRVRAYGCPFLYDVYRPFARLRQRVVSRRNSYKDRPRVPGRSSERSIGRRVVGNAAVFFYYVFGRPWEVGDKLEALVCTKSQARDDLRDSDV
jgi:hypothetical protein